MNPLIKDRVAYCGIRKGKQQSTLLMTVPRELYRVGMWSDAFKTHIINLYKAAARRPFLCIWTKKQKKHKCLVNQQVSPCYDRGSGSENRGGQMIKCRNSYVWPTPSELCSQFWYDESRNRATGMPTCTARSLVS